MSCFRCKVTRKVNTWTDEWNVVNTALVEDPLELWFPLCNELTSTLKLRRGDAILCHDSKASNKFAEVSPKALGEDSIQQGRT